MKKILLFIIAFAFVGCTSPEKKAQKLIKEYLKTSMLDWESYEPVSFGQLDSVLTTPLDNEVYYAALLKESRFSSDFDTAKIHFDIYIGLDDKRASEELANMKIYADSMEYYSHIMDNIESEFTPTLKGWSMTHTFRGNNALGNKTISTHRFYFDIPLTELTNEEELSE